MAGYFFARIFTINWFRALFKGIRGLKKAVISGTNHQTIITFATLSN
jgi:hypothetical protein